MEHQLGIEPCDEGVPKVWIFESEVIGNSEKILWMLGIVDRSTKEARIFSVYDDRKKENLLPIKSNNVSTIYHNDGDIDLRTRVYSDCFSAYCETDFNAMGYRLHRVNH